MAMKGDLDLALHWDRAAPAFQEMVHIGPGSLKFARRPRLYICMYVFMYYACMYVCMYVFMYGTPHQTENNYVYYIPWGV